MTLTRIAVALLLGLALVAAPASPVAANGSIGKKASDFYKKGMKEIERGDYDDAVVLFAKAVAKDSKNADYYNMLGYSYRKLGAFEDAFANYETALRLDPDHRGAHEYIAEAYIEIGDLEMADKHLARLAELCPSGCPEYEQLAAFLRDYDPPAN